MVIYLDIVITLNFIINFIFLKLIHIIQNTKENMIRIIISSLFSIILLGAFLMNYVVYNIIKIIGGLLLILIGVKFNNKRSFIISLCLYYILQFSFIGALKSFNIKGCLSLLILLMISFLVLIVMKNKYVKKQYNVYIRMNNRELLLEGYLDTGNIAKCYNKPIIFLDKRYYDKTLIIYSVVNIKTINGSEFINCYKPEQFYIIDGKQKIYQEVLIAFSNFDNNINCLLNNLLFV